ncbi:MAG TPA: 30S ribosomal protein S4 [Candidatus Pacearchaeota archaeon]|nr:30S ribosomal protein S4 [Candidatus Pacearchaeota archaeon]
MNQSQCKICRRQGQKLFLKGERCFSAKCAMIRRPYSPGRQGRTGVKRKLSDYGQQLAEKQKLRRWYNLSEKQFRHYVSEILNKPQHYKNPAENLIQKLESRLDNIIYRAGWADSRSQARQLVGHGHFQVNNRSVDRPSFSVKQGDLIAVKETRKDRAAFVRLLEKQEKKDECPWLKVDQKKLTASVIRVPALEEINPPAQVSTILEFYTR